MKIVEKDLGQINVNIFECSNEEIKKLKLYYQYISDTKLDQKDSEFSKNKLTWNQWLRDYFVSFSNNKIYLNSGFSSTKSFKLKKSSINDKINTGLLSNIKKNISNYIYNKNNEIFHNQKKIKKIYDKNYKSYDFKKKITEPKLEKIDNNIKNFTPLEYFLALEMILLMDDDSSRSNLLEIGPGFSVLAAMQLIRGSDHATLVELPEVIFTSYCYLKFILPHIDIFLPNEFDSKNLLKKNTIQFLTTDQTNLLLKNSYNRVINTSSFQEMDISVVNNYINLSHEILVSGGGFHSNNQIKSRHTNADLENYNISNFSENIKKKPFVANYFASKQNISEHIYLRLIKK